MWFQQDGATPHFVNVANNLLEETVSAPVVLNGDISWLPRLCGLTSLDYLL